MSESLRCAMVFQAVGTGVLALSLVSPAAAQRELPDCLDDQARILGVVVDASTEMPLSGAYVSVEGSDWGSLTTDDGWFVLCEIEAGTHLVTVERLGYATLESRVEAAAPSDRVALRMQPDPILLEGLQIVTDRFERRRRAVVTAVRTFDQEDFARSSYWSAAEFVDLHAGVFTTPCGGSTCVYYRGYARGPIEPAVYLDEVRMIGGWYQLEAIPTSQLYMIEVYAGGTHIRAYTHHFMEYAAKVRLEPAVIR